jgi:hypothetical protein
MRLAESGDLPLAIARTIDAARNRSVRGFVGPHRVFAHAATGDWSIRLS